MMAHGGGGAGLCVTAAMRVGSAGRGTWRRNRKARPSVAGRLAVPDYVGRIALNPGISTSKARWISQPVASAMMITEPHRSTPSR